MSIFTIEFHGFGISRGAQVEKLFREKFNRFLGKAAFSNEKAPLSIEGMLILRNDGSVVSDSEGSGRALVRVAVSEHVTEKQLARSIDPIILEIAAHLKIVVHIEHVAIAAFDLGRHKAKAQVAAK